MMLPPLEIAGLEIHAPITAATNVVLAAEALWLHRSSTAAGGGPRLRAWSAFFLATAGATLLGAFKHALLPAAGHGAAMVRVGSGAFGAASVALAQVATAEAHVGRPATRDLLAIPVLGLLLLHLALLPGAAGFGPTLALVALGLAPVLATEAWAALRGRPGSAMIVAGLALPLGAAVLWVVRPPLGPWLTHVDVEHVLMMIGLPCIQRGVVAAERGLP